MQQETALRFIFRLPLTV